MNSDLNVKSERVKTQVYSFFFFLEEIIKVSSVFNTPPPSLLPNVDLSQFNTPAFSSTLLQYATKGSTLVKRKRTFTRTKDCQHPK